MTPKDIADTKAALRKTAEKYSKSPELATAFLIKMGYLTKSGKVSRAYSAPRKKASAS